MLRLAQNGNDNVGKFVRSLAKRVQMDFWICWGFIWCTDSGEVLKLSGSHLRIQNLGITSHTVLKRSVDEHFDKFAGCD